MSRGSPGLVTWTCVLHLAFCRLLCSSAFACPLCLSLGIVMSTVYEHCHWNTHWNDITHKATPMLIARRGHWMCRGIYWLLSALGGDRKPMCCCCAFECTVTEKKQSPIPTMTTEPRLKKNKKNPMTGRFLQMVQLVCFHMSLWNFSNIWRKILLIRTALFTIAEPFLWLPLN